MFADQVSSIFWLLHSDLHEAKIAAIFDYTSSMIASLEPMVQTSNGERLMSLDNLSVREENFSQLKFSVRFKRRNGRVRLMVSPPISPPFSTYKDVRKYCYLFSYADLIF